MDLEDVLVGEDDVIPRARYTSPEFAALEFERLWSRGVASGLPAGGDRRRR